MDPLPHLLHNLPRALCSCRSPSPAALPGVGRVPGVCWLWRAGQRSPAGSVTSQNRSTLMLTGATSLGIQGDPEARGWGGRGTFKVTSRAGAPTPSITWPQLSVGLSGLLDIPSPTQPAFHPASHQQVAILARRPPRAHAQTEQRNGRGGTCLGPTIIPTPGPQDPRSLLM